MITFRELVEGFEQDEDLYVHYEAEDLMIESFEDDIKSPHSDFKKAVTNRYGEHGVGANSHVETHSIAKPSQLKKHIEDGLKAGHAVSVSINGKHVKAATKSSYGTTKHQKYDAEGQKSERNYDSRGKLQRKNEFGRGETKDWLAYHVKNHGGEKISSDEPEFYKHNKVEVHHIKQDKTRLKTQYARAEQKNNRGTAYRQDRNAAAEKFVNKHTSDSAHHKALQSELHDKLKSAIDAGDHHAVATHAENLSKMAKAHSKSSEDKESLVRQAKSKLNLNRYDKNKIFK